MIRSAEQNILAWYKKSDRPPLVLRGARQVGKSTLVRQFCARYNIQYIEINLEKTRLTSTKADHFEIQKLLDEIQFLTNKKITPESLIFFDEIQDDPNLLKLLRYFYEEAPKIPIIAAGSLLEIVLSQNEISFPVGRVEFLNLGPMTFFEFLKAFQQDLLIEKMLNFEFSPALHARAMELLKVYTYTGGMPKVIAQYCETKSLIETRSLQIQIIESYKADFPKYGRRLDLERIERIFESSATHLAKKIKYQEIDSHSKAREVRRCIEMLVQARILSTCNHCEASSPPLWATEDSEIFKLYFLDIGLVNAIHGLDSITLEKEFNNQFATKGFIAEQLVAQHLVSFYGPSSSPRLNFWLRDKGAHKGEIDFLVQQKNEIIPIEVKASASGHLKSLFYFAKDKHLNKAIKISPSPFLIKDTSHILDGQPIQIKLIELPIYAVELLSPLILKHFQSE